MSPAQPATRQHIPSFALPQYIAYVPIATVSAQPCTVHYCQCVTATAAQYSTVQSTSHSIGTYCRQVCRAYAHVPFVYLHTYLPTNQPTSRAIVGKSKKSALLCCSWCRCGVVAESLAFAGNDAYIHVPSHPVHLQPPPRRGRQSRGECRLASPSPSAIPVSPPSQSLHPIFFRPVDSCGAAVKRRRRWDVGQGARHGMAWHGMARSDGRQR